MKRSSASILFKQGCREVASLWKQFLSVIAIGAIAVTLFVGLQANASSLAKRVDAMYAQGNLADIYTTVNPIKGNQGDKTEIASIVGDDGIVESRFYSYASLNAHSNFAGISSTFPTISKPSQIVEKDALHSDDNFFVVDEILVSSKKKDDKSKAIRLGEEAEASFDLSPYLEEGLFSDENLKKYKVKDYLLPGVSLEDTPIKTGKIVIKANITAVMKHPENITRASYTPSLFLLSSNLFRDGLDAYLKSFFQEEGLDLFYAALQVSPLGWNHAKVERFPVPNQFLTKLDDSSKTSSVVERIDEYFDKKSEDSSNLISNVEKSKMSFAVTMSNDVLQAQQLCYVFPFVFFAVAILVILTTMSQLILKERTQIGTLKAMGFSRREIQGYYVALTMGVAFIGTLIGEILGPLIIPSIMDAKYTLLYNLPKAGFAFPGYAGLITAVFFLGVAGLVSFLVCRKETSLKPAESMRSAMVNLKLKPRKTRTSNKNCYVLSMKMAFRNIFVNPVKSLMVIFGVMGCTALLCCGYGIEDTMNKGINTDPYISSPASLTLTLSAEIKQSKLQGDLQTTFPNGEIDAYQGFSRSSSDISFGTNTYTSYYEVIGTYNHLNSNKEEIVNFTYPFPHDKLLLTKKVATRISAKVGDEISFTIGSRIVKGEVAIIDDIFYSNGVFIYSDSPLLGNNPITSFSSYWINAKEGTDLQAIKNGVLDSESLSYVGAADTGTDWKARMKDLMSSIEVMTNAVKVFAILLALVVLYNLGLLNFKERIRDIATMKVLGFNRFEIASSLLWETMTLTAVGVAFGLALGFPFMFLVMYINQVELVSYLYNVAFLSYLYSFLLTFVVAFLVNLYLSLKSNKVKMVESLKSVE